MVRHSLDIALELFPFIGSISFGQEDHVDAFMGIAGLSKLRMTNLSGRWFRGECDSPSDRWSSSRPGPTRSVCHDVRYRLEFLLSEMGNERHSRKPVSLLEWQVQSLRILGVHRVETT